MNDLDLEFLAQAFADVGIEVPLGETRQPTADGLLQAVRDLGAQRDKALAEARAAKINGKRRLARTEWLLECMEKDYAKYKQRSLDLQKECEELQKAYDEAEAVALKKKTK